MSYLAIKALHIVGVVCWFAGLFYIVRLFIYHTEANEELQPKRDILKAQFTLMARRLWLGITIPSMLLTTASGAWLLTDQDISHTPWLHLKFVLLLPLFLYHFHCGWIRKKLAADVIPFTAPQLRTYNEVATFLLVGIVFTAVTKSVSTGLWSLVGCAAVFVVLVVFLRRKLQGKS
ncbi:MAG: CopD family protein [Undibacterium sp.]|nr:CopD family protein [Opitutaceae bacterium]